MVARLLTAQTVAEQARIIETEGAGADGVRVGALVALSAPGDAPPLFFAPGAGGHVPYLRALAAELSRTSRYGAWSFPGGEADAAGVEAIATALIADIRRVRPYGPYRLGGHSFGGWVALEIARQLAGQGEAVAWVSIVDSLPPGPAARPQKRNWRDSRWMAEIGNSFARLADAKPLFDADEFDALDDARRVERLRERLIAAGVLPEELGLPEFAARVRAFIAHSLTDYAPATPYAGALHLIVAADRDGESDAPDAAALIDGWRAAAPAAATALRLPGDHVGIMRPPSSAGWPAPCAPWRPRAAGRFGHGNRGRTMNTRVKAFAAVEAALAEPEAALANGDFETVEQLMSGIRAANRAHGLWLPQVPRADGGLGLNLLELVEVGELLGASPLGHYAVNYQAPDAGNIDVLLEYATPAQRQRWLEPLLRGELRSCFAATEPESAGSNPSSLKTTAVYRDGAWHLNGRKWFASGADGAGFAIVLAVTDEAAPLHARTSTFIVPADAPGFRHVRNLRVMGTRAAAGPATANWCWTIAGWARTRCWASPARASSCCRPGSPPGGCTIARAG